MLDILGVGQAHPTTVIDNAFLESLDIGTTNEWIMERVGIATRRSVLPLEYIKQTRNKDTRAAAEAAHTTLTDLGTEAAKEAIQRAGIKCSDIRMVIAGVSVPQMFIPAHACLIAAQLELCVPSFDLNSACSTFAAQLHFLNCMDPNKMPEYILLVQSETYTMSLNYNDRNSAVLFGDGASAQIISTRHQGKAQIIASLFESDPMGWDKVSIKSFNHFVQNGSAVQRFAIMETVGTFDNLEKAANLQEKPYFIGHQANLRMLETSCARIGIPPEKHYFNINKYGNCGAAGASSVLADNWDKFKPSDVLAIATVGAGLSWGGAVLKFGGKP